MEDDDEFGDLYTDVLRPFASSSLSSAPQPHHTSPAPSSIDLNHNAPEIPCAAPLPDSPATHRPADQIIPLEPQESTLAAIDGRDDVAAEPQVHIEEKSAVGARVSYGGDAEFVDRPSQDLKGGLGGEVGADLMDKEVKFDIEEEDGDEIGSEPIIPGLSSDAGGFGAEVPQKGEGDEDWDSDSDDDLQIVLNDNSHMAMERGGLVGDDEEEEEDEDGGLVIVADGDPNQGVEEKDWGENSAVPVDGERKDAGDPAKAGGVTVVPKIGYAGHGYYPFHSQFKYVRPGAAPMPGATPSAPGGPPGQIRPVANVAGRGRGDWRPPVMKGSASMQKGFHAGPGLPGWGNSAAGRGGLDFTLPSHKTIFDVDIESFEEKPWKYPNIDASDFFNFGLNEESWKDYCKQLEQLRLESTMQSKIRVYESGRTEQEYDPDLPPELAAATGMHDVTNDNANSVKSDVGQSDVMKASERVRPPLPTGRAIQVEGGYGERLPSIDTRPPRLRDSDAIIEIVLQGAEDDESSAGISVHDQPDMGEPPQEGFREDHVAGDEIPRLEPEYFDGFPQGYNGRKKEPAGRRMPFMNSSPANITNGNENLFFPQEEPTDNTNSRGQNHRSYGSNFTAPREERRIQRRMHGHSPPITPIRESTTDDDKKEESVESMDGGRLALLSSPIIRDARESSMEDKDTELEDIGTPDQSSRLEKEDADLNTVNKVDTLNDGIAKKQKLTSQVEQPLLDTVDEREDSKAARSSDNSKARSANSRDNQKKQEGFEEEVVQHPRSANQGGVRQHPDENEQGFHRREHDGKQEPEKNRMVRKGREGSYPHKDRHPSSAHQLNTNPEGFDKQKDRDNVDMDWARREDDSHSRRVRNDESRKRDRAERGDKDDNLHPRKQLDNGSYKAPYDKDVGSRDSRHREREEGLRTRYEAVEDHHSKRRKDEEYLRREYLDKEESLHGYRESTSRRRRERDEVLDPRKRDDIQRSRDSFDDQYSARPKDEAWLLRERGDRQREREEWHRMKQSHEEHLPKREREGRNSVRSGRGAEEKAWIGHVRAKDEQKVSEKEYQSREVMRHNDHVKKRDRILDESQHHKGRDDVYARGNPYSSDERRPRQERSSSRSDRVANAYDSQRVHERKHKEGSRKSKEPDASDLNSSGLSKRSQENQSGLTNEKGLRGTGDEERGEHEIRGNHLSRKHQDDLSSDDELQDSRRGRSKLERWTSHKEREFLSSKSSSSLKFKDIDKDNIDGSSEARKSVDESAKSAEVDKHLLSAEGRDSADMESKDADTKGFGDRQDRHLDTVERLKKRSERFKLPMPSEKEALVIKKIENEPLPSAKSENPVDSEVKQERPARKRRWIGN